MAREYLKSVRAGSKKANWEDTGEAIKKFGSNTVNNTGGGPGRTFQQRPIPGPTSPGQPRSMRDALKKKPPHGTATGAAGTLR